MHLKLPWSLSSQQRQYATPSIAEPRPTKTKAVAELLQRRYEWAVGGVGSSQLAAAAAWVLDNMNIDEQLWWGRQQQAAASASHDSFIPAPTAKLFYSISVSYHSVIVFYTVDSVMALKRKISSFFKSVTEVKDKQPKTRVQRIEKASFQQVNFGYYVTISWRVERLLKWLKLKHSD